MKSKIFNLYIALTLLLLGSCNYLDISPVGQVIPRKASEYRAVLGSAYKMVPQHKALLNMRGTEFNPEDDPFGFGLDNFDAYKDIYTWNDNSQDSKTTEYPYVSFYQTIFLTNEIINNAKNAEKDSDESLNQIIGEAYALRAYIYFELANLYAPAYEQSSAASAKAIPITTEIDIEQTFPRATLQEVYDLIIDDMEKAQSLMEVEQQKIEANRYRFSLVSLYALESRVFLYQKQWQKSAEASQKALAINDELEDMNSASYKPNTHYQSKEAILSIEYVTSLELRDYASISNSLLSLYGDGDLRPSKYFAESWLGYMVTNKVNSTDERVSFRRAEIYLNAAEALAHLGKDSEARQFMSTLLKNRYTPAAYTTQLQHINSLSGEALVDEILLEREKELALEGHQWYDWRRTTQPEVKKSVKGEEYMLKKNDPRYTLQIPKSAREANPLLSE